MIISASYKTDIPAFYGQWFINRVRAGYCLMTQPYNRRTMRISLRPEDIDGFVFWTKHIGPFLKYLPEIRAIGCPFMVQYTITGYPRELESAVIQAKTSVEQMHRLANDFGRRTAVWRYDPILLSTLTDEGFHRRNFSDLAARLSGTTDEVIVSFAQYYRKTERNLRRSADANGLKWNDPSAEAKRRFISELAEIASANGMRLSVCTQPDLLAGGACEARCIDAERLASIGGYPIISKVQGNRPGCMCYASRDIGEYDTCPHGCVYCYAVNNHTSAAERHRGHDPNGEHLFPPSHL